MRRFKYFVAALATCSILAISCSKQHHSGDLEGTWEWVHTAGGIVFQVHTPASTGKKIDLKFEGDKYYFYTNGAITSQGTFTLRTGNCIHDHEDKPIIDFSDPMIGDLMIEDPITDHLSLSDNAHDGTASLYKRK
ncbi:MAG TPA: hypothetical protein VD993_15785 [Chitinophagaceae bacterium]|nr:hypothetical protein [Chitinophagaceae bacterium]